MSHSPIKVTDEYVEQPPASLSDQADQKGVYKAAADTEAAGYLDPTLHDIQLRNPLASIARFLGHGLVC